MVNRTRAESWTCGVGISALSLENHLYSSLSESKLGVNLYNNTKLKSGNETLEHEEINCTSKKQLSPKHCCCKDSKLLFTRPVLCTKSMESVDLDENQLLKDENYFSKSNSLDHHFNNSSKDSTSINKMDHYANLEKFNGSLSPKEVSEKLSFNSFLKW